jgi:hypothetical protein
MANDDKEYLTSRILETPAGQEVAEAFFSTLFQTWDVQQSLERARQVAESNGTLKPFELTIFIDVLTKIAPLIIQSFQSWSPSPTTSIV